MHNLSFCYDSKVDGFHLCYGFLVLHPHFQQAKQPVRGLLTCLDLVTSLLIFFVYFWTQMSSMLISLFMDEFFSNYMYLFLAS